MLRLDFSWFALAAVLAVPLQAQVPLTGGRVTQTQGEAAARTGPCTPSGASHPMTYVVGGHQLNTLVTSADPDTRKFLVFVPGDYHPLAPPYPVVYVFPGTGQTGQDIQGNTSWSQAADQFGFIVVYPEGLPYLLQDGTTKRKWNTPAVVQDVDPSELPLADDVRFIREVHHTIGGHLNIDCDRVYATGFSNGGAFVKTRVRVGLADLFAATSSAAGIGVDTNFPPEYFPADGETFRPHFGIGGTQDDGFLDHCIALGDLDPGDPFPMQVADIIATPCIWTPVTTLAAANGLDPWAIQPLEHAEYTQILWDSVLLPGPGPTEYLFRVLPGLGHEYPSGNNYPTDYVPIYYTWMSQFTR